MRKKITKPAKPRKKNDNWNAAFFTAVSIVSLVMVLVYGYFFFFGEPELKNKKSARVNVESTNQRLEREVQEKLPVARNKMKAPAIDDLSGRWVARFMDNAIAELAISGGEFQLLYSQDPTGATRKYSRGVVEYNQETGRLTLRPTRAAGEPTPIKGVRYKILTMRPYDFIVSRASGDTALYLQAPQEHIVAKNVHPLFLYADYAGAPVLKFSPPTPQGGNTQAPASSSNPPSSKPPQQ